MQKDNMKVWPTSIILLWAIVVLLQQAHAQTLSFDLETASKTRYGTFLQNLRNQLNSSILVYEGIPMMPPPTRPPNYLLVELQAIKDRARISMTLALSKNDIYVVAYTDRFGGRLRAHYFSDISNETAVKIFPGADPIAIGHDSNYGHIGGNRTTFQLGFQNFRGYMSNVYGKNVRDNDYQRVRRDFLLIAIQMVAEAARFKYVESKAINNFVPDYKVPELQNNWNRISTGIRRAVKKVIRPPLVLRNPDNSVWTVNEVGQIKPDMGLLGYVA